ncbi:hypothetical protein AGMMS49957_01920 [Synergistales bacterium]|nr:hypothetical protein AGMMS49957_01920 [Synergistales bacterium]
MADKNKYLYALLFDSDKKRLTIFPMRGRNIIFNDKAELDSFIDLLVGQSQSWCQAQESDPEVAFFLDLGFASGQKRSSLRKGLLSGKRKRQR